MTFPFNQENLNIYSKEIAVLNQELTATPARTLDTKWENFWNKGEGVEDIYKYLAGMKGVTQFQERIKLIAERYKADKNYSLNMEEDMFMCVFFVDKKYSMK